MKPWNVHAWECLAACRACDGSGKAQDKSVCRRCGGFGDCGTEWRAKPPQKACPGCGSTAIEHLSAILAPRDVYLRREGKRVQLGRVTITRVAAQLQPPTGT